MTKFIDLTHTFTDDMPVYPGDGCAKLYQSSFIKDCGISNHRVESGMHVGTHMDAPLHMVDGGALICDFPVDKFQGHGVLIDARDLDTIDVPILDEYNIQEKDIILVWTGWDKKYRTDAYFEKWPVMTVEFAQALVAKKISLIGMDTASPEIEDTYPVHKTFLLNNVLIVENMTNLGSLEGASNFTVHAYPIKYKADAAPVRIIAEKIS